MNPEERRYLIGRAETEIALAQESENEAAVQAHYRLAEEYLEKVYNDGPAAAAGLK